MLHWYLLWNNWFASSNLDVQVSTPKFAFTGFSNLLFVYNLACVPISVVNVENVGVTPNVNLPASFSPGTQLFVGGRGGTYGWQPGQSISAVHCWPVIEQRAFGPQKLLQLEVVLIGKFTLWLVSDLPRSWKHSIIYPFWTK